MTKTLMPLAFARVATSSSVLRFQPVDQGHHGTGRARASAADTVPGGPRSKATKVGPGSVAYGIRGKHSYAGLA